MNKMELLGIALTIINRDWDTFSEIRAEFPDLVTEIIDNIDERQRELENNGYIEIEADNGDTYGLYITVRTPKGTHEVNWELKPVSLVSGSGSFKY